MKLDVYQVFYSRSHDVEERISLKMKGKQRQRYLVQLLVHVVFVVSKRIIDKKSQKLILFYQAMGDFQYLMPKEDRMRQTREAMIKGNGKGNDVLLG